MQQTGNIASAGRGGVAAASNAIRGLFGGGSPTANKIEYITIATQSNSSEFGDLTRTTADSGAAASPTRYTIFGGSSSNGIEHTQIMSTGNTKDFGDLTQSISETAGCSNGHGGL